MLPYIFRKYLLLSITLLTIISCKQILEVDLTKENVTLQAPGNELHTTILTHQFIWEPIEGATSYQLQIVKPDFGFIEQFVLDTVITDNKYTYSLFPAAFEWQVRALNGAYESPYTTWSLFIDTTADLTGMPLLLTSPPAEAVSGESEITFRWEAISIAEGYKLEIADAEGLNEVIHEADYTIPQADVQLPNGVFNWRVYAFNSTPSTSNWSEPRSITIDTIAPSTPQLIFPKFDDSPLQDTIINFNYTSGVDLLTSTFDSIWISTDVLFIFIVSEEMIEEGQSFSDSLGIGTYFWKVRTIDAAGNGTTSSSASFIIE